MTDTARDLDRLEAISAELRAGPTVHKTVEHDERGRITEVRESKTPFAPAALAREGEQLSNRIAIEPVSSERAIKALYDFWSASVPFIDEASRERLIGWMDQTKATAAEHGLSLP